jgi:hypothetical protein
MQAEAESRRAVTSLRDEVMERLFTDLQIERFNQLYYQTRAKRTKRYIALANIIAALAASAALTGLLKVGNGPWPVILQILMAVAAVSAAVSPVLGLESKYSQLERAALGHAIAKDRLWCLLRDLKLSDIDVSHTARESEIGAFRDALTALDEDPHDSVRKACWEQVERELPADKAWTII